jgi:hypothetical protein
MQVNPRTVPMLLLAFGFTGIPFQSDNRAALQSRTEAVITSQPQSQVVKAPASATFAVTAAGNPAPSYQWSLNGNELNGATRPSYTTPATTSANNGDVYMVTVSNGVGNPVVSNPAILTVD